MCEEFNERGLSMNFKFQMFWSHAILLSCSWGKFLFFWGISFVPTPKGSQLWNTRSRIWSSTLAKCASDACSENHIRTGGINLTIECNISIMFVGKNLVLKATRNSLGYVQSVEKMEMNSPERMKWAMSPLCKSSPLCHTWIGFHNPCR